MADTTQYWACLAFICLAVPETHPFWTSEEESHWSVIPEVKPLKHPGHIMRYPPPPSSLDDCSKLTKTTSNLGGHCMLLSSGQACSYPMKGTHAKYGAFAYSSAFAYSVPPGLFTLEQYALASQLGLSDDGGDYWKTRRLSDSELVTRGDEATPVLLSRWSPFVDVHVTTYLIPPAPETPNWHLRAHRIAAEGREVQTADGSFAICSERAADGRGLDMYDAERGEGTFPRLMGNYDTSTPEMWAEGGEGAFAVSKGAVGIRALEGEKGGRRAMLVNADPNSNLVEGRTTIPTLQGTVRRGETVWYVAGVFAKPAREGLERGEYLGGWEGVPGVPGWLRAEMEAA